MTYALEAVMNAMAELQKAQSALEQNEVRPITVRQESAVTLWHRCVCGEPLNYGDKYCHECGRRIRWDG